MFTIGEVCMYFSSFHLDITVCYGINRGMKIKAQIASLLIIILSLTTACAFGKKKTSTAAPPTPPIQNRIVVAKNYDVVWKSILELFDEDLDYPVDKADTKKGVIETHWITVIAVDGTSRSKLVAFVKKTKEGTEVVLKKKVERLEKSSDLKDKDKKKDKDKDEEDAREKRKEREEGPGRNPEGWRTTKSDMADAGQVMASLKKKLGL